MREGPGRGRNPKSSPPWCRFLWYLSFGQAKERYTPRRRTRSFDSGCAFTQDDSAARCAGRRGCRPLQGDGDIIRPSVPPSTARRYATFRQGGLGLPRAPAPRAKTERSAQGPHPPQAVPLPRARGRLLAGDSRPPLRRRRNAALGDLIRHPPCGRSADATFPVRGEGFWRATARAQGASTASKQKTRNEKRNQKRM